MDGTEVPEAAGLPATTDKLMRLRYAGVCRLCGTDLPAKADAIYEKGTKTVRCVDCAPAVAASLVPPSQPRPAPRPSAAGSSARREYERRRAKDEQRLRQKWGRLGGVAVALSDERPSTKAWATGAVGEEQLGGRLDRCASPSLAVLHDRRIPGTRANIDHLAITPSGIWVIDAKRYTGRPQLKIEGEILRPRVDTLLVGRRNCTTTVDGVLKQVGIVQDVVGEVPVTGVLCFVDADWPLIGGDFTIRGVHVLWPKKLSKLLAQPTEPCLDVAEVHAALAARLPAA